MNSHHFSMTSSIFPKVHDFSGPGKCVFKFHDCKNPDKHTTGESCREHTAHPKEHKKSDLDSTDSVAAMEQNL